MLPDPVPTLFGRYAHTCVSAHDATPAAAPLIVTVPCVGPKPLPLAHCVAPSAIGSHCTELICGDADCAIVPAGIKKQKILVSREKTIIRAFGNLIVFTSGCLVIVSPCRVCFYYPRSCITAAEKLMQALILAAAKNELPVFQMSVDTFAMP
jgi:hypothetical protein